MPSFQDLIPAPAGRFDGIARPYTPADVARLRGSITVEHNLLKISSNKTAVP